MPSSAEDNRTLIDELLMEQRRVAPAETFSRLHEEDALPDQAKYYRELIPLTKPGPGQQYAFEVQLDKCSGCKACVSACHSLNGLDEGEAWRDVGLLMSDDWRQPYQQTITTACHHCVDPGCLNGCPVLAYDKDPVTGIVRHLDDQCIGCQYCVMKCPYDVPKYSARRGIVRKCDMCANRLAVGEAPACAQACPSEAIRITLAETDTVRNDYPAMVKARRSGLQNTFLPGSPDPAYTLPTTRYASVKPLPDTVRAADFARVSPADPHAPLVVMLSLSQMSVGAMVASIFVESAGRLALTSAVLIFAALGVASLHLGQPMKAWRAFLGWRKSWFSREVIAFGIFAPMAAMAAAGHWFKIGTSAATGLAAAASLTGLASVACSAMIYADTRREFWEARQSFTKFFGTTLVLGLSVALALGEYRSPLRNALAVVLMMLMAAKLAFENQILKVAGGAGDEEFSPLARTAILMRGRLGLHARSRVACGLVGGLICPLFLILWSSSAGTPRWGIAAVGFGFCLAGELLERYLFFTAVAPVRMPGGVTS